MDDLRIAKSFTCVNCSGQALLDDFADFEHIDEFSFDFRGQLVCMALLRQLNEAGLFTILVGCLLHLELLLCHRFKLPELDLKSESLLFLSLTASAERRSKWARAEPI